MQRIQLRMQIGETTRTYEDFYDPIPARKQISSVALPPDEIVQRMRSLGYRVTYLPKRLQGQMPCYWLDPRNAIQRKNIGCINRKLAKVGLRITRAYGLGLWQQELYIAPLNK